MRGCASMRSNIRSGLSIRMSAHYFQNRHRNSPRTSDFIYSLAAHLFTHLPLSHPPLITLLFPTSVVMLVCSPVLHLLPVFLFLDMTLGIQFSRCSFLRPYLPRHQLHHQYTLILIRFVLSRFISQTIPSPAPSEEHSLLLVCMFTFTARLVRLEAPSLRL